MLSSAMWPKGSPGGFHAVGSHAQSKRAFIPQDWGTSCSHPTTLVSVGSLRPPRALFIGTDILLRAIPSGIGRGWLHTFTALEGLSRPLRQGRCRRPRSARSPLPASLRWLRWCPP